MPERQATRSLLVVEDNPSVASLLERGLGREGYDVEIAANGEDALRLGLENDYVALVVDVMIPAPDGITVVRRLRHAGRWAPILILTARDRVEDRIAGLHAGADDYLCKPFSLREVTARVYALSRRASYDRPSLLRVGDLTLDPVMQRAYRGAVAVPLSMRESEVLAELMVNHDQVLTKSYLGEHLLGSGAGSDGHAVTFYINRLKDKLDRRFRRSSIELLPGGYRLNSHDQPPDVG